MRFRMRCASAPPSTMIMVLVVYDEYQGICVLSMVAPGKLLLLQESVYQDFFHAGGEFVSVVG